MEKIWVASHRRSGTHLMMELLTKNYQVSLTEENAKTHYTHDLLMTVDQASPEDKIIYCVRDPRDCMLSCLTWWRRSYESLKSNILQVAEVSTFRQFIEGQPIPNFQPKMVGQWEMDAGIMSDPIIFWANHVKSYLDKPNVFVFKYEDMHNQEKVDELAERLGFKPKRGTPFKPIQHAVGYYIGPQRMFHGPHMRWKTTLSETEIKIFEDKAGDIMTRLGYEHKDERSQI